jgi:hypothetical protein
MAAKSVVLASNVASLNGAATAGVYWSGGRAALVINATAYGAAVNLEVQGPSGAWVKMNASTIAADSAAAYDLPAGQYRINSATGNTTALYASLVGVPYT